MNFLDPFLNALPLVVKVAFSIGLLTLIGIYYLFLIIRVFPWKRKPTRFPSQTRLSRKPYLQQQSRLRRQKQTYK